MLPPPCIDPHILQVVMQSYDTQYKSNYIVKAAQDAQTFEFPASYAYEAYCMRRSANAFYIDTPPLNGDKPHYKSVKETYVAYVPAYEFLTMPMVELTEKSRAIGNSHAGRTKYGYLYYSTTRDYKIDGKSERGFITFLIPFAHYDEDAGVAIAADHVCAVRTIPVSPVVTGGQVCDSLPSFLSYFGQYIWTSNIPMRTEGVTMDRDIVVALTARLQKLCDSSTPRILKRTDKSFFVEPTFNALVTKTQKFEDHTKKNPEPPWTVTVQMVVPFTGHNYCNRVSTMIHTVMTKCFERVGDKMFRLAMVADTKTKIAADNSKMENGDAPPTWSAAQTVEVYRRLWLCSVFILSTELCRQTLNQKRSAQLSSYIFNKFMEVYQQVGAFPDDDTWTSVIADNVKKALPGGMDHLNHFGGVEKLPQSADALAAISVDRVAAVAVPVFDRSHVLRRGAGASGASSRQASVPLEKLEKAESERDYVILCHAAQKATSDEGLALFYQFKEIAGYSAQTYQDLETFTRLGTLLNRTLIKRDWTVLSDYVALFDAFPTSDDWNAYVQYLAEHAQQAPTKEAYGLWRFMQQQQQAAAGTPAVRQAAAQTLSPDIDALRSSERDWNTRRKNEPVEEQVAAGSADMEFDKNKREHEGVEDRRVSRRDRVKKETEVVVPDSNYDLMVQDNPAFEIFKDKYNAVQSLGIYLLGMYKIEPDIGRRPTTNTALFFPNLLRDNPFGLKLYTDFKGLPEVFVSQVHTKYPGFDEAGIYQYVVMYIISQRILKHLETQEAWMQYVDGVRDKWIGKTAYAMQNLGSDLHSPPADASADLAIDSLATRLDRLRDW